MGTSPNMDVGKYKARMLRAQEKRKIKYNTDPEYKMKICKGNEITRLKRKIRFNFDAITRM